MRREEIARDVRPVRSDSGSGIRSIATPSAAGRIPGMQVDRDSEIPLYLQIAGTIRGAIRSGRLAAGERLPSTRDVAKGLGVHRRTVVQAFRVLVDEGLLVSGVGQGTFVTPGDAAAVAAAGSSASASPAGSTAPGAPPADPDTPLFSWDSAVRSRTLPSPAWGYWSRAPEGEDAIRFTGATADPSFFPADDFRAIVDEVFRTHGADVLDYGPAEGHAPLRSWVAERLTSRGVEIQPDDVMIVSGSQQGLDLIARLLVSEGEVVLVEEPGYANGFRLFQARGARVVGVPLDEDGLRIDALEQQLRRSAARMLYIMPHFQNPTGLTLSAERVGPLLEICRRHGVPIVEDQFDGDLYYEGAAPVPLRASDRRDQVVLLGSFSKILFPGLRLGWIVVPRGLREPLRQMKQLADFSSSQLAQYAVDLYCRRGLLDRHLERVRGIYGRRLEAMLEAMKAEFPPEVEWTRPKGGMTLWVTLPAGMDAVGLLQRSRSEGVDFSPGPWFYPDGGGLRHLRLSYIRETEPQIRKGIGILGRLLREGSAADDAAPWARPFF